MSLSLIVRGAPQEYVFKTEAWATLPEHLNRRKLSSILLLHGTRSYEVAKPFLPNLTDFHVIYEAYGGESTDARAKELVEQIQEEQLEAVVAVGGGKLSDLAKQVCHQLQIPVIILPTLASTCAAYTPLSVMYFEHGAMDRFDIFPESNALVLIDPRVILNSPKELLVAGIGDTLAKWYESDAIIRQHTHLPLEVDVARFAAKKCQDNLLTYSTEALAAIDQQELNDAFLKIVETNILLAGMVGGFGDEYGRSAAAHSIHDALTSIPASHQHLHGNKVAYGILVQLVLEQNFAEIDRLVPFYQSIGLPTSLNDLHIELSEEEYYAIAKRAIQPGEGIHSLGFTVTEDIVVQAMKDLESYRS